MPATDSRVAVMGRTVATNNCALTMAYPAVTLRFRYAGVAPMLHLHASSADTSFNLSCNGWEPVTLRLKEGANDFVLPLPPAPPEGWLIELVRRNETWMGTVDFGGLTLPEGCTLLEAPDLPARKFMLIGDSAPCGEFIERFPPEDLNSHQKTINAGRSFGVLLAKWLDAQYHIIAYGGRGIVTDWAGRTETNNAPQFFPLANADDPTSLWDHDRYQPDVILIHFGIADFLAQPVDSAAYIGAWDAFLDQVRAAHPQAPIVLSEAVQLSDVPGTVRQQMRAQLRECLEAVVARRHQHGDATVSFTPLRHQRGGPTDPHPIAFQHEQIALDLLPAIKAAAGW